MPVKIGFFEMFAPLYDLIHFSSAERTMKCLGDLHFLQSDDFVVDLGGGTGRISVAMASKVRRLTVVDASREMLKVAERRGLDSVRGLAEEIPFENESIDKITVIDAFHHFQDPEKAFSEMFRVLKPGGQAFIEEVMPDGWFGKSLVFAEKVLRMGSAFLLPEELLAKAKTIFPEARSVPINKRFYAIVLTKT